jgi:hypothetical protein
MLVFEKLMWPGRALNPLTAVVGSFMSGLGSGCRQDSAHPATAVAGIGKFLLVALLSQRPE